MEISIQYDAMSLCCFTAKKIAAYINQNPGKLICLAAGDTMLGVFRELIDLSKKGVVDLNSVYYVSLDEWVGLDYHTKGSCRQVLFDHFYTPAGIAKERIRFFDGAAADIEQECREIKEYLASFHGIGLSVLGIGMNGHVGFNEPNAKQVDDCIIVPLDEITKQVSVKYFGNRLPVEAGVTIGLHALNRSDEIFLVADGAKKADIVYQTVHAPQSEAIPSTMLRSHKAITFLLDHAAAQKLDTK